MGVGGNRLMKFPFNNNFQQANSEIICCISRDSLLLSTFPNNASKITFQELLLILCKILFASHHFDCLLLKAERGAFCRACCELSEKAEMCCI